MGSHSYTLSPTHESYLPYVQEPDEYNTVRQ